MILVSVLVTVMKKLIPEKMSKQNPYQEAYHRLFDHYGEQGWWPAETDIEILVGAVLTQNTNWSNVEKALVNLKNRDVLSLDALFTIEQERLAELIRPSGYYNLKAGRLKNLISMIHHQYEGELELLVQDDLYAARENLLTVKGIGPETADCIMLYVCEKPFFVVDTYTHRVFSRHNLLEEETDYHTIQETFMDNVEHEPQVFNEYHALIVQVGKDFCKKSTPQCDGCPLNGL